MLRNASSPEDFSRLLEIQTECVQGLTDTYTPEELERWVRYIRDASAGRYTGYSNMVHTGDSGEIDGFVSWTTDGSDATIECLYVQEAVRGRGIGKMLLRLAEVSKRGKRMHVRSTLNAQSFYEDNDYQFAGFTLSRAGLKISKLEKQL